MKQNQTGRSMIEMLGVLAIIGVLSVGGFTIFQRSQQENRINGLLTDTSDLARVVYSMRRHSGEMADFDNNYAMFLNRIGKVPGNLNYDSSDKLFKTTYNVKLAATYDDGYALIKISEMDRAACIKMSSNNWGSLKSNGFIGVVVNAAASKAQFSCAATRSCASTDNSAYSSTDGYPMLISKSTQQCAVSGNYITLGYAINLTSN